MAEHKVFGHLLTAEKWFPSHLSLAILRKAQQLKIILEHSGSSTTATKRSTAGWEDTARVTAREQWGVRP
jgi:hypothetical protein